MRSRLKFIPPLPAGVGGRLRAASPASGVAPRQHSGRNSEPELCTPPTAVSPELTVPSVPHAQPRTLEVRVVRLPQEEPLSKECKVPVHRYVCQMLARTDMSNAGCPGSASHARWKRGSKFQAKRVDDHARDWGKYRARRFRVPNSLGMVGTRDNDNREQILIQMLMFGDPASEEALQELGTTVIKNRRRQR